MFKNLLNKTEVNHFVRSMSPTLTFNEFLAEKQESYIGNVGNTIYTAITTDKIWRMDIVFNNRINSAQEKKHYYPSITFKSNVISMGEIVKQKRNTLAAHFQSVYNPDFKTVFDIINIFIHKGLDSGLINKVDLKKYTKQISTHFVTDNDNSYIRFKGKNVANVSFNTLLQKGTGYQNNYFKTSYINIDIIHLVEPDKTIKPYFKIKLPYASNNKITCIIEINNPEKMYFAASDEPLKSNFLRKLNYIEISQESLEDFFEKQFKQEVRNAICEILKMRQSDLYNLTKEELKAYFVLVEMVKI